MKEILKIIKKFTIPIIFTILVLICQAQLDLSLPDYTAKIINVGISQKGITNSYPEILSSSLYEDIYRISNKKDKLEESYEKVSVTDNTYDDKFPNLPNGEYYILKSSNNIEDIIVDDFLFVSLLKSNNPMISSSISSGIDIPSNANIYDALKYMNEEQLSKIKSEFGEKIHEYDESMVNQISIEAIKNEYSTMGIDVDKIQMNYIYHNGLIMIIIATSLLITAIIVGLFASRIATKFGYLLRKKIVSKIMSFSSYEFKNFSVSSLITRCTNDIQQVQMIFIMFFRIIIFAPILGFGALFKVLGHSISWILALAIGIIILLVIFLFVFAMPKFRLIQKLVDKLNLVSRERLAGVPVIRAFGTAKVEEEKFDKANTELANTLQFCDRIMGFMMPTMMFVMNGVSILIIWVGASLIDVGTLQVGTLMAFITYTIQVIMSFLLISMVSIMLPRAIVSIKRIAEVLNTKNIIIDSDNPQKFTNVKGLIEFKNVSFAYPDADEEVISDINFTARPGTTTAFIGSTGSGKSTLINLIPRFFDVTKGEILIDNVNIKDVKLSDLRENIGYVPQKGNLFSGTIKENVLLGEENTNDDISKYLEISQSEEFVSKLDKKEEYMISQGGSNVSGGQRQRLSIARAIAKNPKIYIFDDSFSALDFKTDVNLRKALNDYTKEATILIVAQRISTILKADQIVVLDEGKIVGIGTHEQLLKNCQVYKEIALSQLKESELNA